MVCRCSASPIPACARLVEVFAQLPDRADHAVGVAAERREDDASGWPALPRPVAKDVLDKMA
jgi:hypothetical protein